MKKSTAINFRQIAAVMERKDTIGRCVPFSFKAWTKDGSLLEGENVVCTSSRHTGTRTIKYENGQIRQVRDLYIFEVNGSEVMF